MYGIGHNLLVWGRWLRTPKGKNVIPIGVEATKPPLCAHKYPPLCTQSPYFVFRTPKGMMVILLGGRTFRFRLVQKLAV